MLSASKTAAPSGGYNLTNSLRFRASASATLTRTFGSTYTDKTKSTFSVWVKRGKLNDGNGQAFLYYNSSGSSGSFGFAGANSGGTLVNDCISIGNRNATTGSGDYGFQTTALYRDPSAWYHIVIVFDTGQATASNRFKLYVNGVQVTDFVSASYPSQNYQTTALLGGNAVAHQIGFNANTGASNYSDLYLAETYFIDGQALTPSSFGSTNATTGVWQPARYTGTYGTNGFYLNFTDIGLTSGSNTGLGKDFSGNGNYWNTNNISVTAGTTYDAMSDVPTLTSATVANYAVLNPLQSAVAPTAGNLDFNSGAGEVCPKATIQLPLTGKWYWESFCSATGTDNWIGVTIDQTGTSFTSGTSYRAYRKTGVKESNGTTLSYGASWAAGDTLGVAVDMDAGTIVFYKNGTSQGTAYSDLAGIQWTVFVYGYINAGHQVNFGQRPFLYTPPTGFVRLNTYNLPDSTIVKGNTVMDATLYTGDGATTRSITNASSFKPDLIWIKGRSNTGSHTLQDSNRGFGTATKLSSNSTNAENNASADATDPIYGYVTAANSNGFTVNNGTTPTQTNVNGVTYVGWQWQAGQGSTSSNTSGSITSTVSINASAGFSVVTFNAAASGAFTVGHGLGVAPRMIITRYRNIASEWYTYHASVGNTQFLKLNDTSAATTSTGIWNNTTPTSTVFTLGSGIAGSTSWTMVAYCWAEIAGFSKFGSYTGNGSTDGPFVYTGFRPKYILIKNSTTAGPYWSINDTSRNTYNVTDKLLFTNVSDAEATNVLYNVDILSNGFKVRTTNNSHNTNGNTYIYAAFAENPFKNSLAR
jgi:hypothetical protein